jgi:DNA-directed RNA polymerase subunit RPC12/RpoP
MIEDLTSNKKATAWSEALTYIECPECNHVDELGSGAVITEEFWECGQCKKTFELDDLTK